MIHLLNTALLGLTLDRVSDEGTFVDGLAEFSVILAAILTIMALIALSLRPSE